MTDLSGYVEKGKKTKGGRYCKAMFFPTIAFMLVLYHFLKATGSTYADWSSRIFISVFVAFLVAVVVFLLQIWLGSAAEEMGKWYVLNENQR